MNDYIALIETDFCGDLGLYVNEWGVLIDPSTGEELISLSQTQ